MNNRLIAGVFLVAGLLSAATAEAKHGRKMTVELLKAQKVPMYNGEKATVYLVKMHGQMMVGIPLDKVPPAMYEQLCARGYCRQ
jgi:hypothetical protein